MEQSLEICEHRINLPIRFERATFFPPKFGFV
jgi:hypothetical protein